MPNFILNITSQDDDLMLQNPEIQCVLLNSDISEQELQKIVHQILSAGKIVILTGKKAVDLVKILNADGVLIDLSKSNNIKKDIADVRNRISGGFLGVICRNRRHEAMIASENDPDFIVFKVWSDGAEKTIELAEWYSEFFLLQMAVFPQDENIDFNKYPADIFILTPEQYKIFVAKK